MKIQLNTDNAVYFDFTDCKKPIFKITCVKKQTYSDGLCRWDILLDVPRSSQIIELSSIRGTKYDAIAEATHLMGYKTDFEVWSYEIYKREWCDLHGYSPEEADENGFNSGECYACLDEYLYNDFLVEKESRLLLFEKAKSIAVCMVKEGCAETTQGNWIFYYDEIIEKFNLTEIELKQLIPLILAYIELFSEEVSDIFIDDNSIDLNFYTNYCPNIDDNIISETTE